MGIVLAVAACSKAPDPVPAVVIAPVVVIPTPAAPSMIERPIITLPSVVNTVEVLELQGETTSVSTEIEGIKIEAGEAKDSITVTDTVTDKPLAVVNVDPEVANKVVVTEVSADRAPLLVVTPVKNTTQIIVVKKLPKIPDNAVKVMPLLVSTIDQVWPNIPFKSFLAAMIEQESCISLTHSKCWNPRAELKMSREYGFGFGQTTIAYRPDGSVRFNVWEELTRLDPELKAKWTWDNRYDPAMQMRAMLIKNRINYSGIKFDTANELEKMAFTAVWYNSGSPLIDRHLCVVTQGCDPSRWFGNVELYTRKSKVVQKGYGKSFAAISREYPRNVIYVRREKYIPYLDTVNNKQ